VIVSFKKGGVFQVPVRGSPELFFHKNRKPSHKRGNELPLSAGGQKTGPVPAGYQEKFIRAWLAKEAYESTGFIPKTGVSGRWLLAAAPIRNVKGAESGAA
jgi:hypothetical protein